MKRAICVLSILGVAACSSHAGTLPHTTPARTGSLSIELKIPAPESQSSARRPLYISPATKSVEINPQGGMQILANVTPDSPGCTPAQSGTICRFDNVGAQVGEAQITVYAYDAPVPAVGGSVGNVLSAGTTVAKIVEGQANAVQLTLGGVPQKAQIVSLNTTPVNGNATDLHFSLKFMDAGGYTIIGSTPFSNDVGQPTPVGVGISQSTPIGYANSFQFTDNGSSSTSGMQIASPNDTYSIVYPGSGVISATLQVQQNGSPPLATATITPQAAAQPFQNLPQLESGAVVLPFGTDTFWITEPSKKTIAYVTNGVEHDIPLPSGNTPTQLVAGPNFAYGQTFVFGTAQGTVGYLTSDGVRGEYALPTSSAVAGVMAENNNSYQIAYTQPAAHKIGLIPMFGGTPTEYTLPSTATPGTMEAGYFVDPGSDAVGYIDASGWKEFPLPTAASDPVSIAPDSEYTVWIAEAGGKRIAHLDTQSGLVAEFPTDAPLTSIQSQDEAEVIAATDNAGNVEYFEPDGTRATLKTGTAGPATQILAYSQYAFLYVCPSCSINIQQFLF